MSAASASTGPGPLGAQAVEIKRRLGTLRYQTDSRDHANITVKPEICARCPHSFCTIVCPAQ